MTLRLDSAQEDSPLQDESLHQILTPLHILTQLKSVNLNGIKKESQDLTGQFLMSQAINTTSGGKKASTSMR